MTVEVRPMTNEDERFYRDVLGGKDPVPVFVGEVAGLKAYGNNLSEVLEHCRQGLAHRAAVYVE